MRTRRSYADSQLDWDSLFDGGSPPPRARAAERHPMAGPAPPPWNVDSEIESFATGAAVTVSSLELRSTIATITESQLERWRAGTTVLIEGDQWSVTFSVSAPPVTGEVKSETRRALRDRGRRVPNYRRTTKR